MNIVKNIYRRTCLILVWSLTMASCSTPTPVASLPSGESATLPQSSPGPEIAPSQNSRDVKAEDPPVQTIQRKAEFVTGGDRVFFTRGATAVDAEGMNVLLQHAERLRGNARLVVTLIGYTDHLGSRSYNLAVAEQRVTAVAAALRSMNVPKSQIRRKSAGGEGGRTECKNEGCRADKRRVDLVYSELPRAALRGTKKRQR